MNQETQAKRGPKPGFAAAKRAAALAAAPKSDVEDALDGFDDEVAPKEEMAQPAVPAEEPEPEVKTRKMVEKEAKEGPKKAKEKEGAPIKPTDDFVRNKKGEIRKDEDGDDMRYAPGFHKGAGFVNSNGVRFPPGYKFKGGFIGTFGNVILNRCPKCFHHQGVDSSRTGKCDNMRAGEEKIPCRYDQVRELEEYTTNDIE